MLSKLALNCDALNKVLEGREIPKEEAYEIFNISEPTEIFATAKILRNKNHEKIVTFSKKVFFNLVNLCRDTCTYCTYKADPGESKLSMMSIKDVQNLAKSCKKISMC